MLPFLVLLPPLLLHGVAWHGMAWCGMAGGWLPGVSVLSIPLDPDVPGNYDTSGVLHVNVGVVCVPAARGTGKARRRGNGCASESLRAERSWLTRTAWCV
jgi:hypothetical protein